jgi:hypothetical protein
MYAHEYADVYRPFIIIELPQELLGGANILYYMSTGRSNDRFQQKYRNTVLPSGGVIETATEEYPTKGFIVKLGGLRAKILPNQDLTWMTLLMDNYITQRYPEYAHLFIPCAQMSKNIIKVSGFIKTADNYNKLHPVIQDISSIVTFIYTYFLFDWQLFLSAKIGLGIWERAPLFKNIVVEMYKEYDNIRIPSIDDLRFIQEHCPTAYVESNNDTEVATFLQANHASFEDIYDINSRTVKFNIDIPTFKTKITLDMYLGEDYTNTLLKEKKRTIITISHVLKQVPPIFIDDPK